ncbi:hypothetical protein X777_05187 [Ooceraea biroi]|uniref:Uncharacterized protein n=1 Tax=Ooceraea biroi TaxID=2015173 RepID=A0A026WGR0_OOCBI|nr:hypothetical protein X777_05187 [Ooceraea biroi]
MFLACHVESIIGRTQEVGPPILRVLNNCFSLCLHVRTFGEQAPVAATPSCFNASGIIHVT